MSWITQISHWSDGMVRTEILAYNLFRAYHEPGTIQGFLHILFLIHINILGVILCPWPIDEEIRLGEIWNPAKLTKVVRSRAWIQSLGTKAQVLPLGAASPVGQLYPEMICLLPARENSWVLFVALYAFSGGGTSFRNENTFILETWGWDGLCTIK